MSIGVGIPAGQLNIETTFLEKDEQIMIRFKDSGPGIPRENMSKLFEPFFTTKKKGKGVGLGLSVAYGIIKEHGGSVYANSKEGKGTTFEIRFPIKPIPKNNEGGPDGEGQNSYR